MLVDKLQAVQQKLLETGRSDYMDLADTVGLAVLELTTRSGVAPLRAISSYFEDVGDFHKKMELPYFMDGRPRNMTTTEFNFRTAAIFEELREFIEAAACHNVAEQGDALVDLVYFALGTAHYLCVPFDQIWRAVQNANMQKRRWREGDPIKARVSTRPFDVVKPEGWRAPDVHGIIADHVEQFFK